MSLALLRACLRFSICSTTHTSSISNRTVSKMIRAQLKRFEPTNSVLLRVFNTIIEHRLLLQQDVVVCVMFDHLEISIFKSTSGQLAFLNDG